MENTYYVRVEWPESQQYMEEPWFKDQAVLDISENAESSTYLIPAKYIESIPELQVKPTKTENELRLNKAFSQYIENAYIINDIDRQKIIDYLTEVNIYRIEEYIKLYDEVCITGNKEFFFQQSEKSLKELKKDG